VIRFPRDMSSEEDTIAAIATPMGQAGIGIIRLSGPDSSQIAQRIFMPKRRHQALQSHRLYLGDLYDPSSGGLVDQVLLCLMKAPHSYTREDVVEINSHSGYLLLSRILQVVLDQGARLARPGEFTLRAFMNGRIDLTQAEAVTDLINARSDRGLELASRQTKGSLRHAIEAVRQKGVDVLARVEVAIDFPEEESGILSREETAEGIAAEITGPVEALLKAHDNKRMWVDGVSTVIVGRVNVGKSSLLNRLLNEQRAIVTPVPGTTRDVIESTLAIEGLPLRLMDTAGFREVDDEVEKIGIDLTEEKLSEADFILALIDQSRPLDNQDRRMLARCGEKKALVVINKIDLPSVLEEIRVQEMLSGLPSVRVSALTGEGFGDLRRAIRECLLSADKDLTGSPVAPNLRHRKALSKAFDFFGNAAARVREGAPMEIVALELKSGLDALGEIVGETAPDEVLERVFSQFCLGK